MPRNPRRTQSHLPDAELEVLACLWQHGQLTAREIREKMKSYRPMAHGSVVTLLGRLEAKGRVTREKGPVGKAFIYRPAQRPQSTYGRLLRNLVQRIFGGNHLALVSSLFETRPPTRRELDELEHLLDQLRQKNKGRDR
jgi:BlaI family transcriptional regulator, penicillinase repressor